MSTRNIYIASPEGSTGKSVVALGLLDALMARVPRVGVFRPLTESPDRVDRVVELLLGQPGMTQDYDSAIGVDYGAMHADSKRAHATIVQRFRALEAGTDAMVVLGSDFTDVTSPSELHFNAAVAADLGASVVLVVHGHHRTPADVRTAVEHATAELTARHAPPVAVIANRIDPADHALVLAALGAHDGRHVPTFAIPDDPVLAAPTVAQLVAACDGEVLRGREERLEHESLGLVVAAMSLPNVLDRLGPMHTVIAPGDRGDLIPGLLLAHASESFPTLAAVVLTGGYRPAPSIRRLIDGVDQNLPVVSTPHDTFLTARVLDHVRGRVSSRSTRKVQAARRVFDDHVDVDAILARMNVGRSRAVTPLMFEFDVTARAKAQRRHIVLPEGNDDRILRAATIIHQRGIARLTVLGEPAAVRAQAGAIGIDLGLDPGGIEVLSPNDPTSVERFAVEYARLRAHKGVTVDEARVVVTDVSYFATMMVHLGIADGMVSGACHTTAETIRPSFEIVKTRPGVDVVSSVFLMCMPDRVLVYGDCAVNPDPDASQLAAIAMSSADTATAFGIEPRIAMLSYSTGHSGAGRDVDKVREATAIVAARRPDLLVEGPIQYDAASDPGVAAAKLPGSAVAGRATVFVFPDLNTGNNTYKAVQRSSGATAIGPVLQGLNRPVNDLSRGATVADIVNTIAITAVQAQTLHGGFGPDPGDRHDD